MSEAVKAPAKPAKKVSPGVAALRQVVEDVYAAAREAKKRGLQRLLACMSYIRRIRLPASLPIVTARSCARLPRI